jgi:hypothetical protein
MKALKTRIEELFKSRDPVLIRIARKLCSDHRINYYVLARWNLEKTYARRGIADDRYYFSVEQWSLNELLYGDWFDYSSMKEYKIILNKEDGTIKAKQQRSKTA